MAKKDYICSNTYTRYHKITAYDYLNSLGPSDAIWWQRSGSTLAQVMACSLTAPSHYLNQCWLMTNEVLLISPDSNFNPPAESPSITVQAAVNKFQRCIMIQMENWHPNTLHHTWFIIFQGAVIKLSLSHFYPRHRSWGSFSPLVLVNTYVLSNYTVSHLYMKDIFCEYFLWNFPDLYCHMASWGY